MLAHMNPYSASVDVQCENIVLFRLDYATKTVRSGWHIVEQMQKNIY